MLFVWPTSKQSSRWTSHFVFLPSCRRRRRREHCVHQNPSSNGLCSTTILRKNDQSSFSEPRVSIYSLYHCEPLLETFGTGLANSTKNGLEKVGRGSNVQTGFFKKKLLGSLLLLLPPCDFCNVCTRHEDQNK